MDEKGGNINGVSNNCVSLCEDDFCNYCSLRKALTAPQLVIVKLDRGEILAGQLTDTVHFESADVPSNHHSI